MYDGVISFQGGMDKGMTSLRDPNCIILKKREYKELVRAADKGIMLHIGLSNSDNYDVDIKTSKGCIIIGSDGVEISPSITKQIHRIASYIKDEFDLVIRRNDAVIMKAHKVDLESIQEDLLSDFSNLPWWKRLFFKPDMVKRDVSGYNAYDGVGGVNECLVD